MINLKLLVFSLFFFITFHISGQNYTFGLSHIDDPNVKIPRGGSTKGPSVVFDNKESSLDLIYLKKNKIDKDRQAILNLAGEYVVYFDFVELIGFEDDYEPSRPYQSWATEYVEVIENQSNFISLQHILVMYFENEDGSISEPMVVKHWREDWRYQNRNLNVFIGYNKWQKSIIKRKNARGTWSQSVFQVDDSPRYQSYGKWSHEKNISYWISNETSRPLPRREASVRDDYDILKGINTITITPNGWTHEQSNKKFHIAKNIIIAKETGLARYIKIKDFDWDSGRKYFEDTSVFWKEVRNVWDKILKENGNITVFKSVDNKTMVSSMFELANELANQNDLIKLNNEINATLNQFIEIN